ncbi:MAG: response regulator, partial [Acidobacteriota bacterium]|nr:response regulator [Acidobacteriota bacterium]
TVDDGFAAGHPPAVAGPHVLVSVTDTGVGMTAEVRRQMFDPFFTTKELGRGTGLGLATVDGIVKQAGGWIEVESEPGQGASFRIFLPTVPRDSAYAAPASPQPGRGTETILVVEDEDGLRQVVTRMLRGAGYTVIHASSARQALALLESHRYQVHLVFTDVVMPGMSGVDLVTAIVAAQPRIKVLFASGYTDDATMGQVALARGRNFIAKPYTVAGLRERIRGVLDA